MAPNASDKNAAIEHLLERHREGDSEALDDLFSIVYPDLKKIATQRRNQINGYPTLTPTSILNEAYLKIINSQNSSWNSKRHFYSVMSLAMRHFILSYIEQRHGKKFQPIELAEELGIAYALNDLPTERKHLLLTIGQLMEERVKTHPEEVDVVNFRIYLGYSVKETAEKMELGEATIKRRWRSVCAWMKKQLDDSINL